MATLKETFTKSITTINVKTNNFMEESKCKTYIATLEEEIQKLKLKAGDLMYNSWSKGEDAKAEVEEVCKEILAKYQEIKAQEEKIRKLAEEEQQILGTGSQNQTQNPEISPEIMYCSQCGMKNSISYKFCCKCGKPLQE